jgi:hypothetical protein
VIKRSLERILNDISASFPFAIIRKSDYVEFIMARMGRPTTESKFIVQAAEEATHGLRVTRTALTSHLDETENLRSWGIVGDIFNTILRLLEEIGAPTSPLK